MENTREYYRWKIYEDLDPVLPQPNLWGVVRRPPSATVWIFGPGDLEITIEPRVYDHAGHPVPASAQIEYERIITAERYDTPLHCWTVLTSYGAWTAMYIEGQTSGTLELNIRLAPYAEEETVLRFNDVPVTLVAELGACLTLPPSALRLRTGWEWGLY
jgi:hypothetical protein